MERFMVHKAGEQYALFCRPDRNNGELSTFRICTCISLVNVDFAVSEDYRSDIDRNNLGGYQFGL
jgi:hypothetical protein